MTAATPSAQRSSVAVAQIPSEPAQTLTEHMLATAGSLAPIPAWFQRHALSLTSPRARQVLWSVGRRLVDDDLGFLFAAQIPLEALGSLWCLWQSAPSLRGLYQTTDYASALLLDSMEHALIEDGGVVWLRATPRHTSAVDRAEQDFRAAMTVKIWRRLHGHTQLAPVAVHFTYARPRSLRAYAALGRTALHFSQPALQLGLEKRWFDAELPGSQPADFARFEAALRLAAREPLRANTATLVDAVVTERLAHDASMNSVANFLGMSVRSLRRQLAERGHTFRQIVDEARRREAELLLELGGQPRRQLARHLGLSGDGALRNAARRWRAKLGRSPVGRS